MAIRKFGTEPAKTEVRPEDNDRETLNTVMQKGAQDGADERKRPGRDDEADPS